MIDKVCLHLGSSKAVKECFGFIKPVLGHAIDLLQAKYYIQIGLILFSIEALRENNFNYQLHNTVLSLRKQIERLR